ncbi:MAG: nucleoid-structuring protein H-NS [Fulvivirga sp.]
MTSKLNRYLPIAALLIAVIVGGASCKSKQKVSELSDKDEKTETTANTSTEKSDMTEKDDNTETMKETPKPKEVKLETRLSDYFSAIANAPSIASANNSINEALNLFESPDALVLIVISEYNGKKDYDRPTTIKEYLNYLKDQKKNINRLGELTLNSAGKIAELELYKK